MNSVWKKDYVDKNLPQVDKNLETPILIIGGGIAGLMCAYNLMKSKIKFILIDGKKLASGVSLNTTAQVSYAHGPLYDEICKKQGENKAIQYLLSQMEGLELINNIIKDEKIECDYKEESTIIYTSEEKNIETLDRLLNIINKVNEDIRTSPSKDVFISYKKGIEFESQFIFNPVKYMMSIIDILIKNNSTLYENSLATKIINNGNSYDVVINDLYKIKTNKIIMACHYPFLNPDNLYFTKIYQSKSYAISFKTKLKLNANYVSLDKPYFYYRTYDNNSLIIGGKDHYTGSNTNIKECYDALEQEIKSLDSNAVIEKKWFTQDCIVIDSLPFVGEYSKKNPNILLVTGFQKWGFTNSHIAAKIIKNMILNNEVNELYKPNRTTLLSDLKSTARMIGHSLDGLIFSKLFLKEEKLNDIKIGSGKVIKYNNQGILVYRENEDKYIFLKNKCTHLGCSLIWNDVEKLWESKCHGSIFDRYGHVIYGPAIKDLEVLNLEK